MAGDPRSTAAWKRLSAAVIRDEPVCWLRYPGICTVRTTQADHIIPVSVRPELALIRANVRGACAPCNNHRKQYHPEAMRPVIERPPALDYFDDDDDD